MMHSENDRRPARNRQTLSLITRVESFIARHRLVSPGQLILVAVSGGPDSTALLYILAELCERLDSRLVVCHLNHQLRGRESEDDAIFVDDLANRLGVPVYNQKCDVAALASRLKVGLEEAGRRARYHHFREARKKFSADRVSLGHTKDDQAETVMHHLLRGTGLRGLAGMLPIRNGTYIRPLLDITRDEITDFLDSNQLRYRNDRTNEDPRFLRNRIRSDLLPLLRRDYNPRIRNALHNLGELARADHEFLESQAEKAMLDITIRLPGRFEWEASQLKGLPEALRRRVVLRSLETFLRIEGGVSSFHVKQVLSLTEPGRSGKLIELPQGVRAWRQFDRLILSEDPPGFDQAFELELTIPGEIHSPCRSWSLTAQPIPNVSQNASATNHSVDENRYIRQAVVLIGDETGRLHVRSAQPGDCYRQDHQRTLKRLWNDSRVPLEVRRLLPVVLEGERPVWIPGFDPASNRPTAARSRGGKRVRLGLNCRRETALWRWLLSLG